MRNFVINYKFERKNGSVDFFNMLKKAFPEHEVEVRHDFPFFAFAARSLPEIQDKVKALVDKIPTGDEDWVVVFYTKDVEPEKIKRDILFGTGNMLENVLTKEQENFLTDLLSIDFVKQKVEGQNK
jgi:hypothetical protein